MIYADYDFYCDEFYGHKIKTEDDFQQMAFEASAYLNRITMGRIIKASYEVKMATCAIADINFSQLESENRNEIASESVGPHSVSYVKKTKTYDDYQRERDEKAKLYLADSGLLYRGVPL